LSKVREGKPFFVDISDEQGVALIAVLFRLLLFTLLGLASLAWAFWESRSPATTKTVRKPCIGETDSPKPDPIR